MRGSKEGTLLVRSRRRASSTSDRFQTPRRRSQRGAGDSMSRRFGRVRRSGRRLPSGTPRRLRPMFVYRVAITPRGGARLGARLFAGVRGGGIARNSFCTGGRPAGPRVKLHSDRVIDGLRSKS